MSGLSDQNRELLERMEITPRAAGDYLFNPIALNRLLDAARAEGRAEHPIRQQWEAELNSVYARLRMAQDAADELRSDAARYRWLRHEGIDVGREEFHVRGSLDTHVDGEIFANALREAGFSAPEAPPPPGSRPSVASPAQGIVEGRIVYPEGWVYPGSFNL